MSRSEIPVPSVDALRKRTAVSVSSMELVFFSVRGISTSKTENNPHSRWEQVIAPIIGGTAGNSGYFTLVMKRPVGYTRSNGFTTVPATSVNRK
jgi:hypothetical protein